jgi:hypothetical protein
MGSIHGPHSQTVLWDFFTIYKLCRLKELNVSLLSHMYTRGMHSSNDIPGAPTKDQAHNEIMPSSRAVVTTG